MKRLQRIKLRRSQQLKANLISQRKPKLPAKPAAETKAPAKPAAEAKTPEPPAKPAAETKASQEEE